MSSPPHTTSLLQPLPKQSSITISRDLRASPPAKAPVPVPRRRLYSRSDLELAVPLSVEIWNFVLPTGAVIDDDDEEDEEEKKNETEEEEDGNDQGVGVSNAVGDERKEDVDPANERSVASSEIPKSSWHLTSGNSKNKNNKNAKTTSTTTRWYKLLRHQTSILDEVVMQMVVQEGEEQTTKEKKKRRNIPNKILSHGTKGAPSDKGEKNQTEEIVEETKSTESSNDANKAEEKEDGTHHHGEKQQPTKKELVLYQSTNDNGLTVNPSWFHLQEKLSNNPEWTNLHRDTYESLEFRFCVLTRKKENDSDGASTTTAVNDFLIVPGHPSQLVSLGTNSHTLTNIKMASTLPINTVVVHYSDQTSRILPVHYELLMKHQPQLFQRLSLSDDPKSMMPTWSSPANRHRHDHHQRQSSLVPRWSRDQDWSPNESSISARKNERFQEDAFKALDRVQEQKQQLSNKNSNCENAVGSDTVNTATEQNKSFLQQSHDLPSRSYTLMEDLRRERQMLLRAIEQEQAAYQQEKHELEQMHFMLREELMTEWNQFQEQTQQIREATRQEREEIEQLDLLMEMHRIRLVRGLEACYPITEAPSAPTPPPATTASTVSSYLISGGTNAGSNSAANTGNNSQTLRGWTLPSPGTLFSTATDEELSAVLGALSHVVLLLAKYLGVPLRYRIFSNSSRSAIQDDRGIIHPLFLARPVEREQVAQGLVLLDRNVMCIAQSRGIPVIKSSSSLQTTTTTLAADMHIFEKVRQLYVATTQG